MDTTPAYPVSQMSPKARTSRILLLAAAAALTCGFVPASAKTQAGTETAVGSAALRETVASMEMRVKPFFEMRAALRARRSHRGAVTPPTQSDLIQLHKSWNLLSPQFRELYARATQAPSHYQFYASPGGHFEVYYTPVNTVVYTVFQDTVSDTAGRHIGSLDTVFPISGNRWVIIDTTKADVTYDAVDTTDTYGYDPAHWRSRIPARNGIPDYVDEIAWALDSSWSMELDRFGFAEPSPSDLTTGNPSKYKVITTAEPDSYYAFTFPGPPIPGRKGFSSSIELRNEWKGWNVPPYLDYEDHPEEAVRVTCVHELFHGVQYAMASEVVGSVYLDDFPIAWLEGTAVLMEELGFDDVNDYLQYSAGYFSTPWEPMLTDGVDDLYSNGLIALYLYRYAAETPAIDFVKRIYTTNFARATPFRENLAATAEDMGTTWDSLLSGFHTGSFFTADRADTSRFLRDAALLPHISVTATASATVPMRSTTIRSFAVALFDLQSASGQSDTLQIRVVASGDHMVPVLLLQANENSVAEYRVLPTNGDGTSSTTVLHWNDLYRAVVVVTNADPSRGHRVEVTFAAWGPDFFDSGAIAAFPNPVRLSGTAPQVAIRGKEFTGARVYSQSGILISHTRFSSKLQSSTSQAWEFGSTYKMVWNLTNDNGRRVSPGTYTVVLSYSEDNMSQQKLQKVLVLP